MEKRLRKRRCPVCNKHFYIRGTNNKTRRLKDNMRQANSRTCCKTCSKIYNRCIINFNNRRGSNLLGKNKTRKSKTFKYLNCVCDIWQT